ncbi:ketosteroid isomerase-related protein [Sinorhizobium psoraleae]|uniref:Nuclear transport factor 2 family protein n=1 Tax=Sinorhizobium psoraleae TaxID=520838 RepID=A0ABT4KJA1_9HYPH|nr:ketosteroid isomerase-related protein [Sinorhizobium psoraleae]MCZ4092028.1 nuclear transport factor 2 family protein [Sinorhizobium psoraleae]
MTDAQTIASRFIEAVNDRDFDALSRLVDEDIALDSLTGQRTLGVDPLRAWIMNYLRHFDETFNDVVLMHDAFGQRVAADMTARGTYRETMSGFPEASGQSYSIPSVFVFEIEDGAITRLSHYRNLRIFERELAG